MKFPIFVIFLSLLCHCLQSQVVADFILPDTVCTGKVVNITNLTTGGSTYYWSFCSANTSVDPIGSVMNNTSDYLGGPAYITLAQDGDKCYSFITNHFNNSVTRFYHGTSFGNDPVSAKNLKSSGFLDDSVQGIQVKNDNGTWYGFVVDDDLLVILTFGNSLANDPVFTVSGPVPGVWSLHGLQIVQQASQHWIGITSRSWGNKVFRIDFGNTLANPPLITDITEGFTFSHPGPLSIVMEGNNYYCFVVNSDNSTLSRGSFGSSLTNSPVWTNLGMVCTSDAMGIMLIRDCQQTNGFMTRYLPTGKLLFRLLMPQGITGSVSTVSMGNIGVLDRPQQFSEITRVRDTVYTFVCNQTSTTITRLSFVTCTNSSIPSSTLFDPPPYSYDSAGIYNVRLTVNEGQPDQQNICKHIVVVDKPPIPLGPDRILCHGSSAFLDTGPNCDSIIWSTGDTTRRIQVTKAGKYWVSVYKFGCWGSDTVNISLYPLIPAKLKPDTTICEGEKYLLNPGKNFQSLIWSTGDTTATLMIRSGGQYWVHTVDTNHCAGADTVTITMKPAINLDLIHDTAECSKAIIVLHATVPGATYRWQDGSTDSIFNVTDPGVYWVRVSRDSCAVQDTSIVHDCNDEIYFPNAFTPNGDGLNDFFHQIGPALSKFTLTIFNRWGQQVFTTSNQETGWDGTYKGSPCPADVYSYIATFELSYSPGSTGKVHGTVMLIR